MYDKVLVPMALDHGLSASTLGVAKALCNPGGQIIALHDKEVVREGFDAARALLAEKTAGIPGIQAEIVAGHTYRTIIDFSAENGIGCVVIGSHKPGLSDYLLGSTAARVVRHAPCAVHVYRST